MQTFFNLSAEQSKGLDKALYRNAQDLYKDANLIAEINKSHSRATSLLILSLEETIKATLVKLHSESLKVYKLNDAKKFFKDHRIRHQIAQLMEVGYAFYEVTEKWQKKRLDIKWISTGVKLLEAFLIFSKSRDRVKRLEKFNDYKNNGLYVGYGDALLDPKIIVTKKHYLEVKEILDRCNSFYKFIRILYHPQLKNHLSQKEVNIIKSDLALFINDAMADFSFSTTSNSRGKTIIK